MRSDSDAHLLLNGRMARSRHMAAAAAAVSATSVESQISPSPPMRGGAPEEYILHGCGLRPRPAGAAGLEAALSG